MPPRAKKSVKIRVKRKKSRRSGWFPRLSKKSWLLLLLFAAALWGGWWLYHHHDRWLSSWQEFVAQTTGAHLGKIMVEGVEHTDSAALKEAIGLEKGDSLVGFDAAASRARIEALPWVRLATVSRELPDTVRVEVFEYQPLARVLDENDTGNDVLWVINREGRRIVPAGDMFSDLPLFVGAQADAQAPALFALLSSLPDVLQRLSGAEYVGQRRWDVTLEGDILVRLPEKNSERALKLLLELDKTRKVLSGHGLSIDLRLEDRIVLTKPDEGA